VDNINFNTPSVSQGYKIPFNLTEQGLTDWLQRLPPQQNAYSCKQIHGVLQAFHANDLTQQQLLIFLPKISEKLDLIADQCEKNLLDSGFPLDPEEQTIVDQVTLAWTALAENYITLGRKMLDQAGVGNAKKASALFLSFQALGKALLNNAEVYLPPNEGFWLNCYRVYAMAENAGLLDVEITDGDEKEQTVNAAFKHLMLFKLSDACQFRPREMKAIYSALKKFSASAKIETNCNHHSVKSLCAFNLNRDQGPRELSAPPEQTNSYDRYFSPIVAARSLHQFLQQEFPRHNALQSINRFLYTRVIKSLGLAHIRKFSRSKEQRSHAGIIGFNHLVSFLYKVQDLGKEDIAPTPKKNPGISRNWKAPDFELVPMGEESMHQTQALLKKTISGHAEISKISQIGLESSSGKKVWNPLEIEKNKLVETVPTGEFEIIDSSAKGFLVLWKAADLKVKVGDIFGLPTAKGDRVEVGLIRRISRPNREEVCLGIEIIGFQSEAVRLFRPGRTEMACWAVLLPGIPALKQADSIIYNTSDFSTGEFIILRRGKKDISYRLNTLINSTAAITHMELYSTPESP
jgi:hypothetical protein